MSKTKTCAVYRVRMLIPRYVNGQDANGALSNYHNNFSHSHSEKNMPFPGCAMFSEGCPDMRVGCVYIVRTYKRVGYKQ